VVGLLASLAEVFPFGHFHAQQVARTQPEKFAAIEGLYTSQTGAPLAVFAVPFTRPPQLRAAIEIPGLLSWMAFGDVNAPVRGINEFPPENRPPLWLTFVSFHNMVVLGLFFIAATGWGVLLLLRQKLWERRRYLRLLVWSIPLPIVAMQLGWVATEVGRQPWIVYGLLRTSDAASRSVGAGEVLFSTILFTLVYLALGALWLFLMVREVKHGPEPARA
jgi:cytochrome d ubiquinol oxidase subunit I